MKQLIYNLTRDASRPYAVLVGEDSDNWYVFELVPLLRPTSTDALEIVLEDGGTVQIANLGGEPVLGREALPDAQEYYTRYNELRNSLRESRNKPNATAIGLHYFQNSGLAVADLPFLRFSNWTGGLPLPTEELLDLDGNAYKVLDARVIIEPSGTFTYILFEPNGIDYTQALSFAQGTTSPVDRLEGFPEYAGLWRSIATEDADTPQEAAWSFLDLGWKHEFTDGDAFGGILSAKMLNVSGEVTEGTTDPDTDEGRPMFLTQGAAIPGKPPQFAGWKLNTSPPTFALNAGAVAEADSQFVFADALVTWTDTGTSINANAGALDPSNNTGNPSVTGV